jgi:hypothetical protein
VSEVVRVRTDPETARDFNLLIACTGASTVTSELVLFMFAFGATDSFQTHRLPKRTKDLGPIGSATVRIRPWGRDRIPDLPSREY